MQVISKCGTIILYHLNEYSSCSISSIHMQLRLTTADNQIVYGTLCRALNNLVIGTNGRDYLKGSYLAMVYTNSPTFKFNIISARHYNEATTTESGLMSTTDKTNLDNLVTEVGNISDVLDAINGEVI